MGPSGSGKSTLLNLIAGLDRPTSGTIRVGGQQVGKLSETAAARFRRRQVGMIFQFFNLLDDMTVADNVLLPAQLAGVPAAKARARLDELLAALRITQHKNAYPARLSGGERQRVAIARALVNRPPLLLADEPTGALDTATGEEIGELLLDLNAGQTLILVTHDPALAARYAKRVIRIVDGQIAAASSAGMRAMRTALRGGLAGRRVQALVIGLVLLVSAAASTLAAGLLVDSNAPFDHAFAAQHGADAMLTVNARKAPAAELAAAARLAGVTAAAGPFAEATVSATAGSRRPGPCPVPGAHAGRALIAGRAGGRHRAVVGALADSHRADRCLQRSKRYGWDEPEPGPGDHAHRRAGQPDAHRRRRGDLGDRHGRRLGAPRPDDRAGIKRGRR